MGIFYDDPYNIKEATEFRASVGLLFQEKSVDGENFFKLKGYKVKYLPKVNSIFG